MSLFDVTESGSRIYPLIAASFLPGKPPRDPADRIIAATARDYGATLITRDRALLDYGKDGHVKVVAC